MDYILALIGTGFAVIWVLLFLRGVYSKKYSAYIAQLTNSMFVLKDIYFIGFAVIDMFHINCQKGIFCKNSEKTKALFGEKYAVFYQTSIWAGKITLFLTILPVMIFLGLFAEETIISWMGFVIAPLMAVSLNNSLDNRITEKQDSILMDLPQVVSKMAMLINAGMTLQAAWEQIAYAKIAKQVKDGMSVQEAWSSLESKNQGYIYHEMYDAVLEMENAGVGTEIAFMNFARRCGVQEVRKFASLVLQNMKKGGTDLVYALQDMANERWQQKKHMVLRKGELAGNKLLIPIMLMFVGVLVLIMVPAFMSMQTGI